MSVTTHGKNSSSWLVAVISEVLHMIWKDIEGYEGLYQVSDTGEVRGLDRKTTGNRNRTIKGTVLKKGKTTTGYWLVVLSKDGKSRTHKVHRLVAKVFINNPQGKPNVNHIDNNPLNNNVENLEWCTQSENVAHAYRIGAHVGRAKPRVATDEVVEAILAEYIPYDRQHSIRAICKRMGIKDVTIYGAVNKRKRAAL